MKWPLMIQSMCYSWPWSHPNIQFTCISWVGDISGHCSISTLSHAVPPPYSLTVIPIYEEEGYLLQTWARNNINSDTYIHSRFNLFYMIHPSRTKIQTGGGVRGYKAANYPPKASACKGQKLGGWRPPSPPGSAALASCNLQMLPALLITLSYQDGCPQQAKHFTVCMGCLLLHRDTCIYSLLKQANFALCMEWLLS